MRKAVIDLDLLDYEITAYRGLVRETPQECIAHHSLFKGQLAILEMVKSHCTPIIVNEEPKEPFLSKTCVNDWESNAYCSNTGKCELCKIKQ